MGRGGKVFNKHIGSTQQPLIGERRIIRRCRGTGSTRIASLCRWYDPRQVQPHALFAPVPDQITTTARCGVAAVNDPDDTCTVIAEKHSSQSSSGTIGEVQYRNAIQRACHSLCCSKYLFRCLPGMCPVDKDQYMRCFIVMRWPLGVKVGQAQARQYVPKSCMISLWCSSRCPDHAPAHVRRSPAVC